MSDRKLRIPGPDENEDLTRLDDTIFYGLIVGFLLCGLAFVYGKYQQRSQEIAASAESLESPKNDLEARQREIVTDTDEFREREWEGDDTVAVLRYGPRKAAEAACRATFEANEDGLPRAIRVELLASVNRSASHTPWTCLLRAYLDGQIGDEAALAEELDEFWRRVESFDAPAGILTSVLEDFAETEPPDSEAYRRWVTACALREGIVGEACRTAYQAHGGPNTLLGVVDLLVDQASDIEELESRLAGGMEGLSGLAKQGTLGGWKRPSTIEERDVRLGAIFWMCRLVQSPDERLAWSAAEGLSDVVNLAVRAGDDKLVPRWREACRLAFRTGGSPKDPLAPGLAVWSGNEGAAPDYSLSSAADRGACETSAPENPEWMCGIEMWRGDEGATMQSALMDYFTDTRWVEWQE